MEEVGIPIKEGVGGLIIGVIFATLLALILERVTGKIDLAVASGIVLVIILWPLWTIFLSIPRFIDKKNSIRRVNKSLKRCQFPKMRHPFLFTQ